MDAAQLSQLEGFCNALYNVGSEEERKQSHAALLPLAQNPKCMPQLQFVLAHTSNPYALIFSATGLTKLITAHWTSVSDQQKLDMRNFLLDYLAKNGPDLYRSAPMGVPPLVRLFVRVIKLAWLEGPQYQNITERVGEFLQQSPLHWVLGLEIYTDLTTDMQPSIGPSMSRFRRTALSFRDTAMSSIFTVAIQTLRQMSSGQINIGDKNEERRLTKQVLQLTCNCLSFDYMGTIPDESSDEQGLVMCPHGWSFLRDEAIPKLLFDLVSKTSSAQWYESTRLALQCLVLLASLRRSFFQDEERMKFVASLMQGTTGVLTSKIGIQDTGCYHEVCRLLGKINATHQLGELLATEQFAVWVQEVYTFTMDSLQHWDVMPNSKHYLLGFWAAIVGPLALLQDKAPKVLETFIQQLTLAYVESRLFMAEASADPTKIDWDDPLEDEVLRAEQLEVLANLGRCRYQETAQYIMKHFEEVSRLGQNGQMNQVVFEKKMTWVVYMMGALVGGNSSVKANRSETEGTAPTHVVNGELAGRIFKLVNMTDQQPAQSQGLELAYLYFMEQFRKVYIGEHAKQVVVQQQISESLATVLGLEDENAVLGLLINKIGNNLQRRYAMEPVIKRTLAFFHELAAGINIVHTSASHQPHLIVSGRLLLKNDMVRYILGNHASSEFGFLNNGIGYGKYRTIFYHTLGKLLFMDIRDNRDSFEKFMQPLGHILTTLWQQSLQGPQALRQESCKLPLIGLCRDLRGICQACTGCEPYEMLFDWLVDNPKTPNSRVTLFSKALDVWWEDPEVTTPLLKFMNEFVHNKAQRINFCHSSPNGILLFREASQILVTYGTRILQRTHFTDIYVEKYKGIGATLDMFYHALHGGYAPFGVFEIYADSSLSKSMSLALQMCLAIPLQDLNAYLKALKPYYQFLDLATRNHMPKFMELTPHEVQTILQSVEEGLMSYNADIYMQCCAVVDNIICYFYTQLRNTSRNGAEMEQVQRFLNECPSCLQKILNLMFQLVMTGEFSSTWSISRPLLGLILVHENYFLQLKEQLINLQIEEKRTKLRGYFDDLMHQVESDLTTKNKDRFTRNLYNFAQFVRTLT